MTSGGPGPTIRWHQALLTRTAQANGGSGGGTEYTLSMEISEVGDVRRDVAITISPAPTEPLMGFVWFSTEPGWNADNDNNVSIDYEPEDNARLIFPFGDQLSHGGFMVFLAEGCVVRCMHNGEASTYFNAILFGGSSIFTSEELTYPAVIPP